MKAKVVDDTGTVREVRRIIDNDLSGGTNSPKQQTQVTVGGSTVLAAIAAVFALLAFGGVLVSAILIPEIIEARAAQAAAPAEAKASYAERDARVALDKLQTAQLELNRQGFKVDFNAH